MPAGATRLRSFQAAFATALRTGDGSAVLPFLAGPAEPALARVSVYRTTFLAGTIDALAAGFPAVAAALGPARFRTVAAPFVVAEPPALPALHSYGGGFPAFLERCEPDLALPPWLVDLARFEWAQCLSCFAADAAPLAAQTLTGMATADCSRLWLRLHPSVQLVRSAWPVLDLWRRLLAGASVVGDDGGGSAGAAVLVVRPALEVFAVALSPGEHSLIAHCAAGSPLADAATAALAIEPGVDLEALLTRHLHLGTFCDWSLVPPKMDQ